jgi:xylan 1,4-beta-xylosidase
MTVACVPNLRFKNEEMHNPRLAGRIVPRAVDDLLARHIKPFVELGFTPNTLATSQNSIFYWHGITSHPKPDGWHDLVEAFTRNLEKH